MEVTEELLTTKESNLQRAKRSLEDNMPQRHFIESIVWSVVLIITVVTLFVSMHTLVYFDNPLDSIKTHTENNVSSFITFTLPKPIDCDEIGYNWKKVVIATVNDYIQRQQSNIYFSTLLEELDKFDDFESFIESILSTGVTLSSPEGHVTFNTVYITSTYHNFKTKLLTYAVGVVRHGLFVQCIDNTCLKQVSNDGIFHALNLRQISPLENGNIHDPVYYEAVGYDDEFVYTIDSVEEEDEKKNEEDNEEEEEETDVYSTGAFYIRSPGGNETWQNFESLQMNIPAPLYSKFSERTWIACEDFSLSECTNLQCTLEGKRFLSQHGIDCTKNLGLVSSSIEGCPSLSEKLLQWKVWVFGEDEKILLSDVDIERVLEPIPNTLLRYQHDGYYGFGALPYDVLLQMEKDVDIRSKYGYYVFDISYDNK
ncbi:Uncharacterized protein QTN25_009212 [Entamoeba marina]